MTSRHRQSAVVIDLEHARDVNRAEAVALLEHHKRADALAWAINRFARRRVVKGYTIAEVVSELRNEADIIEAVGIEDLPNNQGKSA
ncbi:hypothetical protein CT676_35975 [Bradyrhizobium sp. MOS001]|jgi:hypothetical protein|uniref:hypothetical protein n=1 Tax=Bradyrhizobium sp. MOS001 TaxID=2133948 RepID=UPI001074B6A8|nr:hypothetical protein [Bradyrhizobium sp. MOS001]TFW56259.1 hypothetical protein CT676_35975 [Bradyrhizobium sp. MOS001]